MFAAPPTIETTVFARLPDHLRMKDAGSEFISEHPGHVPSHSILEGPSFDQDGTLFCVDIAFGRIFTVSPDGEFEVFANYDGWPTGLKIHRDGRIFVADFKRGIVVINRETRKEIPFLERYHLEHLRAPNDLVFASNGDLFFTDQGLTGLQDATGRVFRVRADGRTEVLLDNVPSPNGIALDPSEEILYVAATRANAIWRAPLLKDGTTAKVGTFIQMSGGSGPDGIATDENGNLAVAHVGLGVVWLFSRRGEPLFRIDSCKGAHTTNVAYGGADRRSLFITELDFAAILRAELPTPGLKLFSGV